MPNFQPDTYDDDLTGAKAAIAHFADKFHMSASDVNLERCSNGMGELWYTVSSKAGQHLGEMTLNIGQAEAYATYRAAREMGWPAVPAAANAATAEAPTAAKAARRGAAWQKRADVWQRIRVAGWQDLHQDVILRNLTEEEKGRKEAERRWLPPPRMIAKIVLAGKHGEYKPAGKN